MVVRRRAASGASRGRKRPIAASISAPSGQEPGWFLEIDKEKQIRLVYDYAEHEIVTPAAGARSRSERPLSTT